MFHGTDEALKANKLAVIDFVIGNLLRLFHPFLPFITEELARPRLQCRPAGKPGRKNHSIRPVAQGIRRRREGVLPSR